MPLMNRHEGLGSDTNPTRSCCSIANLEDGGGRSAAEAAGGVERVDAEELVDEAAGDAHHGGAAVLALDVELEGLGLLVVVTPPRVTANVARLLVLGLGLEQEVAGLHHAGGEHDLQPAARWGGPRGRRSSRRGRR